MINGKKIKNISEGVDIALNVVGAVSGSIPVQVLANAPKILVKLLEHANFFENDMNDILQTQFDQVIQQVIKGCAEKLESKRLSAFIECMVPLLEENLSKDLTFSKLLELLELNFTRGCYVEGFQITPKEIRELCQFFIKELKNTILQYSELANHLEINILDNYFGILTNHEERILSIENKFDEFSVDLTNDFIFSEPTDINLETDFIGRSDELEYLESLINNNSYKNLILISGIGGIGKTEICRYIYKKNLSQFYINENTIGSIGYMTYSNSMDETIYRSMKYPKTGNYNDDKETAWSKLFNISNSKRSLLIIDNVDKRISEDNSITKLYNFNGFILLTSRFHDYGRFKEFSISSLEDFECIDLFESTYNGSVNDSEKKDLNEIIFDIAARHTKTIILIAKIANDQGWPIQELKTNLKKCGFKLCYITEADEIVNIQEEYMKLFNLAKLNFREISVLEAFSLFPYESLEISYCKFLMTEEDRTNNNEFIFTLLYKKGWLEKSENGFSMHPIISQIIFSEINNPEKKYANLIQKLDSLIDVDEGLMNSKSVPLLPFVTSICNKLDNSDSDIILSLLMHTAGIYAFLYSFDDGEYYFEKAEKLMNKICPEVSLEKGNLFYQRANLEYKRGKYKKARDYLNLALPVFNDLSKDLFFRAKVFLGQQYLFELDYENAKQIFKDVIMELEKTEDKFLLYIVKTYLINALSELGDIDSAYIIAQELYLSIDTLGESIDIIDESIDGIGQSDKYIANSCDLIANVYSRKGELDRALQLKLKALEMHEKIFDDQSIDVGNTYLGIGNVYHSLGKYSEAEKNYNNALDILNSKLKYNHPWFVQLYYEMGNLKIDMKDYNSAIDYLEKAVEIGEKILNRNDRMMNIIYNELRNAYIMNNQCRKAEILFLKVSKGFTGKYKKSTKTKIKRKK